MTDRAAKETLRRLARIRLETLDKATRQRESDSVCRSLRELWEGLQRPTVSAFWPVGDEINISGFIREVWRRQQAVLLPRVQRGRRLAWHQIFREDDLVAAPFGLREPNAIKVSAVYLPAGTFMIVPGLAFTRSGMRLGYGGGYFDRTLASWRGRALYPVGVAYATQLVEWLPVSARDVAVAEVIVGDGSH